MSNEAEVQLLKAQLIQAQRAYDHALAQRDAARAEVAKMKARPVEAEYARFDAMWQKLVEERDKARTQLKRTREAVKLVAEERDAARETALRPSQWLIKEGNELVRKFNAIRELVAKNGEHPLASQINDVLNEKENDYGTRYN